MRGSAPARPRAAAPFAVAAAIVTAALPLTTLLAPPWFLPASAAAILVVAAGHIARRVHRGFALAAELIAWILATALAFPGPTVGGLLPWGSEWGLPAVVASAGDQIVTGVAPVQVGAPLAFALISAIALLAVVVDQVAVAARLPVIALVPLIAVFITPQLAVPRDDHLLLAVPFALALLALVATARSSRSRCRRVPPRTGAATVAVALVAVLGAIVVAPRLPVLPSADSGLLSRPTNVDVSIDLGDDLRNASNAEMLRVRTTAGAAPYLRLATHTRFGADGWELDAGGIRPLRRGFEEVLFSGVVGEVETRSERTWIGDVALDAEFLPVPDDAVAVAGAAGEWNALLESRTVRSTSASAEGETYRVDTAPAAPTRDQLDASPWVADGDGGRFRVDTATREMTVFDTVPPAALEVSGAVANGAIGSAARSAAGDAPTPYAAALALQEWLRGSEFAYSLETPVEQDFDGSDVTAVEQFLEVREGYCVHFASAYALMARALGLPTRIVVGFLPGAADGSRVDDMDVYSVAADRLHAWPEVYLVGIGWTRFDPTPGVAQAQGIVVDAADPTASPEATAEPSEEPEESAAPTATPTIAADDEQATGSSSDRGAGSAWLAVVGIVLAAGLLLLVPAMLRHALRVRRLSAARRGDVLAAWRELTAIAFDARLDLHAAETPRALGARLVALGAAEPDVDRIVAAVEHWAFSPDPDTPADLATPLRAVARALRAEAAGDRARRFLAPRSLWARARTDDIVS
ncbi:transglutaminase TgpA family protein [Microbacterium karelineae]|uniref:transglutaminase TgpA family protein n=1 Tax=Microbacterium karelineae TaxID=2654283 RepID=UPI0012EA9A51|nr:transglutaminaseTgpA domain-containing protein [Microbacterium karelineae]